MANFRKLLGLTSLIFGIFAATAFSILNLQATPQTDLASYPVQTLVVIAWLILTFSNKIGMTYNQGKYPLNGIAAMLYLLILLLEPTMPIREIPFNGQWLIYVIIYGWPAVDFLDIYLQNHLFPTKE